MAQFNPQEIEKSVIGVRFPADKEVLLAQASANGTDQVHIDVLNMLLPGTYNSVEEIMQALTGIDGATQEASEEID
jgi:hypothetical protein